MNDSPKMQRRTPAISIRLAALLCAFASAGFFNVAARGQTAAQAPELVIESSRYHFGEAFAGETLSHAFAVRNAGNRPLELSDKIPLPRTSVYRPQDDSPAIRRAGLSIGVRSRSASPT